MRKEEFLKELEKRLMGLPKDEIDSRLSFYSEMIDDRVEDGKTEEEAILDLGGTDEAVRQIVNDTKFVSLVKNKIKPKRRISGFEVLLLIIGFPLWFPLLIVFGVLLLVAYLLLWILVIVTYSVEFAILSASAASFIRFFMEYVNDHTFDQAAIAVGLLSAGVGLLFLFLCAGATKASFKITKNILFSIKNKLIGGAKWNQLKD